MGRIAGGASRRQAARQGPLGRCTTSVTPPAKTAWNWCGSSTFNMPCTTTSSWSMRSTTRKSEAAYDAMLDKLAATLEAYTAKPTADAALLIGQSVRRLEDAGQAPALVRAIQYHFVHPNLLLDVSSDVVGAGIADCVDDVTPVRDCILGTDICATAHTTGQTCVATVARSQFRRDRHAVFRHDPERQRRLSPPRDDLQQLDDQPLRPQTALDRRRRPVVVPRGRQRRDGDLHPRHPVVQGPPHGRADGLEAGRKAARPGRVHRLAPRRISGSTSGSTRKRPNRSIAPTKPTSTSSNARSPSGSSFRRCFASAPPSRPSRAEFAGRRRQIGGPRRAASGRGRGRDVAAGPRIDDQQPRASTPCRAAPSMKTSCKPRSPICWAICPKR